MIQLAMPILCSIIVRSQNVAEADRESGNAGPLNKVSTPTASTINARRDDAAASDHRSETA